MTITVRDVGATTASGVPEARDTARGSGATIGIRVASTVYALVVLLLTSAGVGAAARRGILIPVAVPFAGALIVTLRLLRPSAERGAWALFTVWLGSTYLSTGAGIETAAALAYVALALGGVFVSPWLLVAAWALHPAWDLLPRTLPDLLHDLPMACLLFDGAIALYLARVAYQSGRARQARQPLL